MQAEVRSYTRSRVAECQVRTMLRSYLIDDSAAGSEIQQYMSLNEIIRDGKIARDRQRVSRTEAAADAHHQQMFKFADTDARSHGQDFESLQQVLKTSVPGLVTLQDAQNVMQGEMANAEDRYSTSGKHRTIIPPNAFNVSTLFQPTLAFLERAGHIIPPGFQEEIGAFSMVLEDFVVKVFLPQLDERVTASFQQAVSGYDAYQIDRRLAGDIEKPPIKSSSRVMSLIHHLCIMLATTPFHRENYSRLIVGVIVQYYQHCSSRFKGESGPPTGALKNRIGITQRSGWTVLPACHLGSAGGRDSATCRHTSGDCE